MKSRYRLLGLDLDGTLLNDRRTVSAVNRRAIAEAVRAGVTVVLASGRFLPSMAPFIADLELVGPVVATNGAHVLNANGSELAFHAVDPTQVDVILEFARERRLHVNAYTRTELFFLSDSEWGDLYRSRLAGIVPVRTTIELLRQSELTKIMFVANSREMTSIRSDIESRLDSRLVALTESEPEYLECLSARANKGSALELVASSLGIASSETAAIGDYLNDLEMLRWAGLSGAVANARPEVKAIANVQVFSNECDGVAYFIHSYVLD